MLKVEPGLEVHGLAPINGQLGGADGEGPGGEDLACKFGGAVERALVLLGNAVDQSWEGGGVSGCLGQIEVGEAYRSAGLVGR